MREKIPVFAVVRIEDAFTSIENGITIKEILPTLEEALREVERLNKLQASKRCHYFCQQTRYYPDGRGIEPGIPPADSDDNL